MHAACLCVLKDDSNLYLLGHNLVRTRHLAFSAVFAHHSQPAPLAQVDADPESAVAWFAVGCYYYCIGRHKEAATFFSKAVALDPQCAPAWLGVGHAASITVSVVAGLARECCAVRAHSLMPYSRVMCVTERDGSGNGGLPHSCALVCWLPSSTAVHGNGVFSHQLAATSRPGKTHSSTHTTHLTPQYVPLTHTRASVPAPIA